MKTVGIIGGIGPESTIEYYRFIIDGYRQRRNDDTYPSIVINSVDLRRLINWIEAGEFDPFTDYLAESVEALARAGADFAVLAANTAHIVFDRIQKRSTLPLISIVDAARAKALALGLKRPGLLGTRFTMHASFYPDLFAQSGLPIITPNETEQDFIHEKYFGELLKNVFRSETRDRLLEIVTRMKERDHIDGLILAGTELPLLLRDAESDLPFLNTTKIHVARIVEEILR